MRQTETKRTVVQVVRTAERGTGVGNVVLSLDDQFQTLGYSTRIVTAQALGVGISGREALPWRVAHALEVLAFSLLAPAIVLRLRRDLGQSAVIVSHNDCVAGDIYVNHGLHKELIFPKGQSPRLRILLRNPLHIFMLARESVRHGLNCNRIVVNFSKSGETEMLQHYKMSGVITELIPNGIDLSEYYFESQAGIAVRESLKLSRDDIVLGFVGNEFERKGLSLILNSLPHLPRRVRLIAVGGSPSMVEGSRARAIGLGVEDRASFVGKQSNLRAYYSAFDALVLPSTQEAWPLVLLEAMACGVPCLATGVSSVPDFLEDGINGYLVRRDPADICSAVERLLDLDDHERRKLSSKARSTAERYSWSSVAHMYDSLFRRL